MAAFWQSLIIVFLLELGDKTQLVALCLACRFNARVVLAGIFSATLAVHVVSVLLGGTLAHYVPHDWISFVAGLAFLGFGAWTLRGDSLNEEECGAGSTKSAFWLVATTFFLAELGDKTMLGTVALATRLPLLPVWLGSTVGMVISDGLAIVVGQLLGKRLPERLIKIGAALVFFGYGLFTVIVAARKLPTFSWAIAGAVILGLAAWLYRDMRQAKSHPELELTCAEREEPVV